jgi:hypothetical protein
VAEVAQPAEGRWVVVIDAFQASQPVAYRLTDGWTHPRFGSFTVAASAVGLGSGARWQGVGHRWTAARPDAGRVPYAHLQITSPRGRRMVFREGALQAETVPLGTLDLLGKP